MTSIAKYIAQNFLIEEEETMREIVKLECEGRPSWNEGSASAQEHFIDSMTRVRVEQYKSVDDKIEALLNKIVFPEEMIKEALKPKKKKLKFNAKCVICDDYMSDVEEEDYNEGCNDMCDKCSPA